MSDRDEARAQLLARRERENASAASGFKEAPPMFGLDGTITAEWMSWWAEGLEEMWQDMRRHVRKVVEEQRKAKGDGT